MNVIQNKAQKLALALLLGVVLVQPVSATESSPAVSTEPALVILNSVVRVSGENKRGEKETTLGFVVSQGFVVSSAGIVQRWKRITVKLPNSGPELVAQNIIFDQQAKLALIEVDGVNAPALKLFNPSLPFVTGSDVFSVVIPAPTSAGPERLFKKGTLNDIEVAGSISMSRHNATISMAAAGGPLFDECGNVLGVNLPLVRRRGLRSELVIMRDFVQAIHASHLASFLRANNVEPVINNDACATSAEKAAALEAEATASQAQQAELQAEINRKEAEATASQAQQAELQAEIDRKEAEATASQAQQAELQAEINRKEAEATASQAQQAELQAEIDRKLQEEEKQAKLLKLVAIAAGVAILIALLAWIIWGTRKNRALKAANRRAHQAEQEAIEASEANAVHTATFDCLLEGEDVQGESVVLKIPKASLVEGRPAVIGRNPRNSEFLLDKESISRAHTALIFSEGQLFAKDMMSTNGTKINGMPVSGSQQMPLRDGDVLEIGSIKFKVRL